MFYWDARRSLCFRIRLDEGITVIEEEMSRLSIWMHRLEWGDDALRSRCSYNTDGWRKTMKSPEVTAVSVVMSCCSQGLMYP